MTGRRRSIVPQVRSSSQRLASALTEKRFLVFLLIMFIVMAVWVETLPYDPMNGDIADATTNAIWTEYYKEGKVAVTYEEWKSDNRPNTQSVVVELNGKAYVVNEKGPAHAVFTMVFGSLTGTLFAGIATISTYMLGRRVFNWKVGAISSLLVLTNLTLVTMWYKDYWVDASTPHLLILGIWLFVESGLRMKSFLDGKGRKALLLSVVMGIGGGVAFGTAIATRYTVAVVIIPAIIYIFAIFGKVIVHSLKERDIKAFGKTFAHMTLYFLPFFLGLMMVVVPLMNYNITYFGGPFQSGYDATSLMDYERTHQSLDPRNQTDFLSTDPMGKVENIAHNAVVLAPVVLLRMLCLLFVPVAMWKLWKRPVFWLLFIWGLLIMLGFYSMDWVDKYAQIPATPWEPRYQLPALPPFALLGGYGLYALGKAISIKIERTKDGFVGPFFVIAVTGLLIFANLGFVSMYFKDVHDGKNTGAPNPGGPPGGPGGQGQEPVFTIQKIYNDGKDNLRKAVQLQHCTVSSFQKGPDGQVIRFNITDSSGPRSMLVLLHDFPPGTAPNIQTGMKVTVVGLFDWMDFNKNGIIDEGEPAMNVKYGTPDRIIIEN